MNILEIIRTRRSVRDFTDQEIPENIINELIDALRWAPSAGNLQSRKFYFVFKREIRETLSQARHNFARFVARAPLAIVACADLRIASHYGERGSNLYCIQDTAASVQNLLLAAHGLGLATCWVGAFQEDTVREILDIPANLRPVAIVAVGFPAEAPKPPQRVSKEEAVIMLK